MPEFIPQHAATSEVTRLDDFTRAYLEALEWTDCNTDHDPMFDEADGFAPSLIEQAKQDCAYFQETYAEDLEAYCEIHSMSQAGHDFWLTRNRHGAGFWDRGAGEVGDRLTTAAHGYGEVSAYVGDDMLIYT